MSNIDKYKQVKQDKDKNPEASIGSLCKKYGVKYHNYHQWLRRAFPLGLADKGVVPPKAPVKGFRESGVVIVRVPLEDVIGALYKRKDLVIRKDRLLECLDPARLAEIKERIAEAFLKPRSEETEEEIVSGDGVKSLGED